MSTPKETVLKKHTFARETLDLFDFAEKKATNPKENEILCVQLFIACARLQSDILHKLPGRPRQDFVQEPNNERR